MHGSPVKTKQFPRDQISSCMLNKESGARWQSLLPLPAFSAGESEGGSASRVTRREVCVRFWLNLYTEGSCVGFGRAYTWTQSCVGV